MISRCFPGSFSVPFRSLTWSLMSPSRPVRRLLKQELGVLSSFYLRLAYKDIFQTHGGKSKICGMCTGSRDETITRWDGKPRGGLCLTALRLTLINTAERAIWRQEFKEHQAYCTSTWCISQTHNYFLFFSLLSVDASRWSYPYKSDHQSHCSWESLLQMQHTVKISASILLRSCIPYKLSL